MLKTAHEKGVIAALQHFKVAAPVPGPGIGAFVRRGLIGEPGKIFTEGLNTFRRGGTLSPANVFWPKQYGTVGNWMGRLGTVAMVPAALHGLANQDPREGRLSHALGTLGGLAGGAYGAMGGGVLGMPLGAALGSRLGHGAGHLLGSHPQEPSSDPRIV